MEIEYQLNIINEKEIFLYPNAIIGAGSFGKVEKGNCRGQDVAVKTLPDGTNVQAFLNEVKVMSNLRHPNVVLYLGTCTSPFSIVMEIMQGTLTSKLQSDPPLPLSKKIQYAMDICKGMAWLHGQGVIHRDLKPDNILLDANDNCKVSDFGLSEIIRDGKGPTKSKGSPKWMAPEVLLNMGGDTKSDVYSFGMVFWQILTGKPLFPESFYDLNTFIDHIAYKNVRPFLGDINPIFQRILQSTWHPNPTNRPEFINLIVEIEKSIIEIYFDVCACAEPEKVYHNPMPSPSLSFRSAAFMWMNFRGCVRVTWRQFLDVLHNYFPPHEKVEKAICHMICVEDKGNKNEQFVTIEKFRDLLLWFGDIQVENSTIIQRMEQLLQQSWFCGTDKTQDAERNITENTVKDCFLVRLNLGGTASVDSAPVTISKLKETRIKHSRITFENERKEYKFADYDIVETFPNTKEGVYKFMDYLITKYKETLFKTPCTYRWKNPNY